MLKDTQALSSANATKIQNGQSLHAQAIYNQAMPNQPTHHKQSQSSAYSTSPTDENDREDLRALSLVLDESDI